jgi:hypothetical protein
MLSTTKGRFQDLLESTAGLFTQVFVFKKTGAAPGELLTAVNPCKDKALSSGMRC